MRKVALILCLFAASAFSNTLPSTFSFEPNRGQTDSSVRYLARTGMGMVFFTDTDLVLHRHEGETVRFSLIDSDTRAPWEELDSFNEMISYHVGRDQTRWADNVPRFGRLLRRNVYPGIDVVYYESHGRLEYDFVLAPQADPSRIRIRVAGARNLSIDEDGDLAVGTSAGRILQRKPVLYQKINEAERAVEGKFRIVAPGIVGFEIARYDRRLPLSIDPTLEFSTFLGGGQDDAVVASNGSISVGTTTSIDFPGTTPAARKGRDVFVTGLGSAGNSLTLIFGGSGDEHVTSGAFTQSATTGSTTVVVGGYTDSQDLPTVNSSQINSGLFQAEFAGGATDGFLLVVQPASSNGFLTFTSLLTYIGTPGDDRITAVAATAGTNLWIAGTTNGQGLPAPPAGPVQIGPRGGLDGFVISGFINSTITELENTIVFGGSGDDTPHAVIGLATGDIYVAGETRSSDFPLGSSTAQLNGTSDAFVLHLNSSGALLGGTLFGGSGTDRATSIVSLNGGALGLAGVTSSTDLPVANAAQAMYGGGDSDAFFARISFDLSTVFSATYLGGSGVDEAISAAADSYGNVFVGGRTTSTDFPVKNAIQPAFGGGADDGFLIHFDVDGSIYQASYLGGSGSDHVFGMYAPGGPTVWIAGETTSSDFPTASPTQAALYGTSDGFIARVSANLISLGPVVGAKDLRTSAGFSAGNTATLAAAVFTITSSDPTTVLLAVNPSDPGSGSITAQVNTPTSGGQFYIDCLTDTGGADITISGAGYTDRTTHASCYPTQIAYSYGIYSYSRLIGTANVQTSPWAGATSIYITLDAAIPANTPVQAGGFTSVRPGANSFVVNLVNSNPGAGTLSASQVTLSSTSAQPSVNFQPLASGVTNISFTSDRAQPPVPDHLTFTVVSPLTPNFSPITIPAGFEQSVQMNFGPGAPAGAVPVTVTSQDPSSLLVSADTKTVGAGSATVNLANGSGAVTFQALAAGAQVPITISSPGFDSTTATIQTGNPVAIFAVSGGTAGNPSAPISLGVSESAFVTATIGVDTTMLGSYAANPGTTPPQFGLAAADATTVKITATPSGAYSSFQIQGVTPGSTMVVAQPPAGIPFSTHSMTKVPVTVIDKPLVMADLQLGKDLQALMTVSMPVAVSAGTTLTITSSDPTLVVVAPTASPVAAGTATLTAQSNGSAFQFYAQGLAATGQAKITVQAGSYGAVTATVTLSPSGFAWNMSTYTAVLFSSFTSTPSIQPFSLDPATMQPAAQQALRTGAAGTGTIVNSNPGVVSLNITTFPNSYALILTGESIGTAVLSFAQPAGFSTPASGQLLNVNITAPSLSLSSPGYIGKDSQAIVTLRMPGNLTQSATFTSGDPSKVVLSADPNAAGSASVTVPAAQNGSTIYAQGLANSGTVTISASSTNYLDANTQVRLGSLAVAMQVNVGATAQNASDGSIQTTAISGNTSLSLILEVVDPISGFEETNAGTPRPGVSPWTVTIQSSNATVGTIVGSPVQINGGQSSASAAFKPAGVGQTTVAVVQPAGFLAPLAPSYSSGASPTDLSRATINVIAPSLVSSNLLLGKDTIGFPDASLQSIVPALTSNVTVTITSSDPTKVLVSATTSTPAAGSITRTLVAGQRSVGGFIVHAIGNSGTVPVTISAPGFADGTMNIALSDLAFSMNSSSFVSPPGSAIRIPLQAAEQTVYLTAAPVTPPNLPSNFGTYSQSTIRPGVPPITITVNSTNPAVLAVDTPQVIFQPGSTSANATFHPVSMGSASLTLSTPSGYLTNPNSSSLNYTINGAMLGNAQTVIVGRDLQLSLGISPEIPFSQPTAITIVSSDPSGALLSTDVATPGQASITLTAQPNQSNNFYVQGLRDNGTVTVTITADSYQSSTVTVNLAPAAAGFTTPSSILNIYSGTVQHLGVILTTLDPNTLVPSMYNFQGPRPGANLQVGVTSSDNTILEPLETSLTIPAQGQATLDAAPLGVGTAILSLSVIPGEPTAALGRQIVFNVQAPDLAIPNFTLGQDLMVPVQVTLAARLTPPAFDTTLFISTQDTTRIGLSTNPAANFQNSITVILPAGQTVSKTFYVHAISSTGTASLQVFGGNYNTSGSTVTLSQTAFVFKEASGTQPIAAAVGSSPVFTIVPSPLPLGTPLPGTPVIRPNAGVIMLTVVSSNPGGVSVPNPTAYFTGGSQQALVTVNANSAGGATLSLTGSNYVLNTAASTLSLAVK